MATDARAQGALAFQHNQPMSACQYPAGSTLRQEWMDGWTTARNAKPAAPSAQVDSPYDNAQGMSERKLDDIIGADDYEAGAERVPPER
jgi:ribosome modulation factor